MRGRVKAVVTCVLAVAVVLVAVGGCSHYNDKRGKGDAPVMGRRGEDTPAKVYNMPDGFGNLATKCVGKGFRAFVTTNNSGPSNVQIVDDKTCK